MGQWREVHIYARSFEGRRGPIHFFLQNKTRHSCHLYAVLSPIFSFPSLCEDDSEPDIAQMTEELKQTLEEFDYYWASFEQVKIVCIYNNSYM